jgi:transcriptional regulator with XRE-family HTH domain
VDAFVGAKVKEQRKSAKWSQSELADKIGVTFQQVQKYERGTNRIGASRLWRLSQVLSVPVGYFFEGLEQHLISLGDEVDSHAQPHPANDDNPSNIEHIA